MLPKTSTSCQSPWPWHARPTMRCGAAEGREMGLTDVFGVDGRDGLSQFRPFHPINPELFGCFGLHVTAMCPNRGSKSHPPMLIDWVAWPHKLVTTCPLRFLNWEIALKQPMPPERTWWVKHSATQKQWVNERCTDDVFNGKRPFCREKNGA